MGRGLQLLITSIVALYGVASAEEIAGRIKTASGDAVVVHAGKRIPAKVADPVAMGDVVETGADGSLGITFRDASRLSIGPNSQVVIDEYVFSPLLADASFSARVKRGTLFYVSGLIAKMAPGKTNVKTPDGTVGIRGTRLLVSVADDE